MVSDSHILQEEIFTPKRDSAKTSASHEDIAVNLKVSKLAELGGDDVARYKNVNLVVS